MNLDIESAGDIEQGDENEFLEAQPLSHLGHRSSMAEMDVEFLVPTRHDDDKSRSKKFLFRLVQGLHSSGQLSYVTEDLIQKVALVFDVHAICAVLPVTVSITFNSSNVMNPKHTETYLFRLNNGIDCWKQMRLTSLCNQIEAHDIDLYMAENILQEIEDSEPLYPWWLTATAYAFSSGAASLLYFNGTILDSFVAFFLGYSVYATHVLCSLAPGLLQIECFLSCFVVASFAYLIETFVVSSEESCFYAQLFGGVTWLLPGLTIIISLLEIYSQMIVYGAARLVNGVSLASQLGFGIIMACGLFFFSEEDFPKSLRQGCGIVWSPIFKVLLIPIMSLSTAILVNVSPRHFAGVVTVASMGEITAQAMQYYLPSNPFTDNATHMVAAFVVTVASRIFGHSYYFIFLLNGICLLVPGGIGLNGMSRMWSGDMESGIIFTFKMFNVGVALAIGVFVAMVPQQKWFGCLGKKRKNKYFPIAETKTDKLKMLRPSNTNSAIHSFPFMT